MDAANRRWMKKSDLLLLAGILAAAGLGFLLYTLFAPKDAVKAEIYVDHVLVKTVDLSGGKAYSFSVPQRPKILFHVRADGKIAFEESDCPDKICIRTGFLSRPGESAVCLPRGVVLKIARSGGDPGDDPDLVR